ncbi:MAG: hypothetical protein AB1567_02290 [bacterium]
MKDLFNREVGGKGLILSEVCVIASLPYLYYMYFIGMREIILKKFLPKHLPYLVIHDVWYIFIATFLCGVCGFGWSKKYGLCGFGSFLDFKKDWLKLLIIGGVIGILSYQFFDKPFKSIAPYYYPTNPIWALTIPINSAFFIETIRFGMVSLVQRLIKNVHFANFSIAFFFAIVGLKSFIFIGLDFNWSALAIACFTFTVLLNIVLGYIFIKKGLISTIFVHLVADLKFVVLAFG